jgi:hypothetical protein
MLHFGANIMIREERSNPCSHGGLLFSTDRQPRGPTPGRAMAPRTVLDRASVQEKVDVSAISRHGDRMDKMKGLTCPAANDKIDLVFNAELDDKCCFWKLGDCCKCRDQDRQRSYMIIRETALEINDATLCCCTGEVEDNVKVYYFDNDPFTPQCVCCNERGFCCCPTYVNPRVELAHNGCVWCCVKCDPCCGSKVSIGITPFQRMPFPCCCCSNHTTSCDHFCACYGIPCPVPVLGNPMYFIPFKVQPKNPATFITVLNDQMARCKERGINPAGLPTHGVQQQQMDRALDMKDEGATTLLLTKTSATSKLGISLDGANGPPHVTSVASDGVAFGVVLSDDILLSVNGVATDGHEQATSMLKAASGKLTLLVRRLNSNATTNIASMTTAKVTEAAVATVAAEVVDVPVKALAPAPSEKGPTELGWMVQVSHRLGSATASIFSGTPAEDTDKEHSGLPGKAQEDEKVTQLRELDPSMDSSPQLEYLTVKR